MSEPTLLDAPVEAVAITYQITCPDGAGGILPFNGQRGKGIAGGPASFAEGVAHTQSEAVARYCQDDLGYQVQPRLAPLPPVVRDAGPEPYVPRIRHQRP